MSQPKAPGMPHIERKRAVSPEEGEPPVDVAALAGAETMAEAPEVIETPQQRMSRVATIIAISLIVSAIASGAVTVLVRQARARRASLPPARAPRSVG